VQNIAGTDVTAIYRRPAPTIALCMIVRDEAAVIERCIESVRPLIDSWQICDTGSVDGTPEIARRLLGDLPGELYHRPWRDFGWNRSELMQLAAGSADYLLLLDADMTLSCTAPLPPLTADAYRLHQAGAVSYAIPRLVRGDRPWRYQGSTHEYLTVDGHHSQELLEGITVEHWADGGSSGEKFSRDVTLLERDLEREPENRRVTFYLAQTHRDLGNRQRALELYRRRAGLGGWDEEVFYSLYQAGVLLAARDDDAAIPTLLLASQRCPRRAEPLHEMARLLRYRSHYRAAYTLARYAVTLARPDDLLFVHDSIYDWGLRFELAIAAYWMGDIDQALELNDALLAEGRLPPDIDAAVRENRSYCLAHSANSHRGRQGRVLSQPSVTGRRGGVPALKDLCPSAELRTLSLDVSPAWPIFNPTITADQDGFHMIMRTANYRLVNGRYWLLTHERVVRTINYWVTLNGELEITAAEPLSDARRELRTYPTGVQGYEDCRLLRAGDAWFATATVRDHNPQARCEIALLRLSGSVITDVCLQAGPSPGRHEKNWMPFSSDGALHAVYSCDPTIVLALAPATGAPCEVTRTPGPPGGADFRGGSQGVPLPDGLLFVVHEVDSVGERRVYSHRFMLMDGEGHITGVSPAFHFTGRDVEFCAGLASRDGELVLSFGVDDGSAALGLVDANEVIDTLRPSGQGR
jgi:glycosyltransferase involved in cell wall biosynthesis/predicted GH43/DUF377 family glycosyl hydrolase